MKFVEKCPRCGGQVVEKNVREILYGGQNTAFIKVNPNNAIATKTSASWRTQRMKLQLVMITYSVNLFHFFIH